MEVHNVNGILRDTLNGSQKVLSQTKMSLSRQTSHNRELESNGNWYFWAILIEMGLFIAILAF